MKKGTVIGMYFVVADVVFLTVLSFNDHFPESLRGVVDFCHSTRSVEAELLS